MFEIKIIKGFGGIDILTHYRFDYNQYFLTLLRHHNFNNAIYYFNSFRINMVNEKEKIEQFFTLKYNKYLRFVLSR